MMPFGVLFLSLAPPSSSPISLIFLPLLYVSLLYVSLLSVSLLLPRRALSYSRKLIQLQSASEFRLSELETTVDEIRGVVAQLLWKLMVQEADLIGQLKVLKDFYLLGRGELFLTFIDQAMPLLW